MHFSLSPIYFASVMLLVEALKKCININVFITEYNFLTKFTITFAIEQRYKDALEMFLDKNKDEKLPNGNQRYVKVGFTKRTYYTRIGVLMLTLPRLRDQATGTDVVYYEGGLNRAERMEKALKLECFVLRVAGTPVRAIRRLMIKNYGEDFKGFSERNIHQIYNEFVKKFELEGHLFEEQAINHKFQAIYVDATYFKLKGKKKLCVMAAIGYSQTSGIQILGMKQAKDNTESEASYLDFIDGLIDRGLKDPWIVIADGAPGFWKAATERFKTSKQQQCLIHLCREVFKCASRSKWKLIGEEFKKILRAESKDEAIKVWDNLKNNIFGNQPTIQEMLTVNQKRKLTFMDFPVDLRNKLYTSNQIETLFSLVKPITNSYRSMMKSDNVMFIFKLVCATYKEDKSLVDLVYDLFGNAQEKFILSEKEIRDVVDEAVQMCHKNEDVTVGEKSNFRKYEKEAREYVNRFIDNNMLSIKS